MCVGINVCYDFLRVCMPMCVSTGNFSFNALGWNFRGEIIPPRCNRCMLVDTGFSGVELFLDSGTKQAAAMPSEVSHDAILLQSAVAVSDDLYN